MSNDFSQYDQSHQSPQSPPSQKSGCGKGCLIVILILGAMIALFVGALLWIGHHVAQGMTNDPTEIANRLKERFPTAQLPPGYTGKFGMKFAIWLEMDMMIFGAADAEIEESGEVLNGKTLLLFSMKAPGMSPEQLEDGMQISNNGGKVIEKRPYPIRTGDYEFEGYLQKIQRSGDGQGRRTFLQLLVPLGNSTMLVMQSNNDTIDEPALKQFLLSIAKDCPNARKRNQEPPQK
jgi:hypothetical protein